MTAVSAFNSAISAYNNASKMGGESDGTASSDDATAGSGGIAGSFADLVSEGMESARSAGYQAEATSTKALANKAELHDLVTAVGNADLTLNTVVALRDRMVSAYQDVIKMPI